MIFTRFKRLTIANFIFIFGLACPGIFGMSHATSKCVMPLVRQVGKQVRITGTCARAGRQAAQSSIGLQHARKGVFSTLARNFAASAKSTGRSRINQASRVSPDLLSDLRRVPCVHFEQLPQTISIQEPLSCVSACPGTPNCPKTIIDIAHRWAAREPISLRPQAIRRDFEQVYERIARDLKNGRFANLSEQVSIWTPAERAQFAQQDLQELIKQRVLFASEQIVEQSEASMLRPLHEAKEIKKIQQPFYTEDPYRIAMPSEEASGTATSSATAHAFSQQGARARHATTSMIGMGSVGLSAAAITAVAQTVGHTHAVIQEAKNSDPKSIEHNVFNTVIKSNAMREKYETIHLKDSTGKDIVQQAPAKIDRDQDFARALELFLQQHEKADLGSLRKAIDTIASGVQYYITEKQLIPCVLDPELLIMQEELGNKEPLMNAFSRLWWRIGSWLGRISRSNACYENRYADDGSVDAIIGPELLSGHYVLCWLSPTRLCTLGAPEDRVTGNLHIIGAAENTVLLSTLHYLGVVCEPGTEEGSIMDVQLIPKPVRVQGSPESLVGVLARIILCKTATFDEASDTGMSTDAQSVDTMPADAVHDVPAEDKEQSTVTRSVPAVSYKALFENMDKLLSEVMRIQQDVTQRGDQALLELAREHRTLVHSSIWDTIWHAQQPIYASLTKPGDRLLFMLLVDELKVRMYGFDSACFEGPVRLHAAFVACEKAVDEIKKFVEKTV